VVVLLLLLYTVGGGIVALLLLLELSRDTKREQVQFTDAQRLLGKWVRDDSSFTLEFLEKGKLREERLLKTVEGSYKLLPQGRVEMHTKGVLWGASKQTLRYELTRDCLILIPEHGRGSPIRYWRAD